MPKYHAMKLEGQIVNFYSNAQITSDPPGDISSDERQLYLHLFGHASKICKLLKVRCPYIGLVSHLHQTHPDGSVSIQDARMYDTDDIPTLDRALILVSLETYSALTAPGVLAHELRHLWQRANGTNAESAAVGFKQSLSHPDEIDADGFAIWYLATESRITLDEAGSLLCATEQKGYPDAYMLRIKRAESFGDQESVLSRLKRWMRR